MEALKEITIGTRVAKSANKTNTDYWTGMVKDLKDNKALVYFDSRGFSRWCNLSKLEKLS